MGKLKDDRLTDLQQWLQSVLPGDVTGIVPLQGDASFRRYFRLTHGNESHIAVDAPPATEKNAAFIGISQAFSAQGVAVPKVIAHDESKGFLLLSDLGDALYSGCLNSSAVDSLYLKAIDTLVKIQKTPQDAYPFPAYNEALLLAECELFSEWYLLQHLKLSLSVREQAGLKSTFARLVEVALEQPTTVVHRDYHSRNLLMLPDNAVGVLDFQDAVIGPISYDVVSLLKDCYVAWPASNVINWAQRYFEKAREACVFEGVTMAQFLRWFDLMGVQRHLKCMGIFSRLYLRDNKPGYLADIPRLIEYILSASSRHPQLNGLAKILKSKSVNHESHDTRRGARQSAEAIDG